ncbi:hypothetical protein U5801_16630 [Lamprobacter modestohalophilus]|uniref:hypothetical protein n=1 Tax=Lamprobacter modestohalophilus TaxID=1064514 RepID=UPI002ADEDA93|nr:hypothetical protein [Lamprobacter modestohalophilus]MEA1051421.1 hypothetical protein [Lamprobacter modestohalophilus]
MSGPQRAIYDDARQFLQRQEPNFLYVDNAETAELTAALADPHCFKGSRVQQMKRQLETLKARVDEQVQQRRTQAIQVLQAMQARMQGMDEYQTLPEVRQAELDKPYQDLVEHRGQQPLIAVINDRLRYFEDQGYQKLLAKMVELATPKPPPSDPDTHGHAGELGRPSKAGNSNEPTDHDATDPEQVAEPAIEYIPARRIQVAYDKAWLADEGDVERYLESMREALIAEIRKGKRKRIQG